MSDIAIKVEGIGKKYRIGKRKSGEFRESFGNLIQLFKSKSQQPITSSSFWALKDISFEVKQGEAVGIIGRNGAGKSTLLKVLSRITKPTIGRFEINGRVSSLLEVGTGFHPELTGRENIYLNGTILGMRRVEIKAKFDEIIAFSGVEEFIDTPVKHYSSGMKVRLAFSVAAHLEPEILIIDEVLAVGDAEFQKKCLGKMEDVTCEGRTVLFVSHNMKAVEMLCDTGMLLKNGKKEFSGNIDKCIENYLGNEIALNGPSHRSDRIGSQAIQIKKIHLTNKNNERIDKLQYNVPFKIKLEYEIHDTNLNFDKLIVGLGLKDYMGNKVLLHHNRLVDQLFSNEEVQRSKFFIFDCAGIFVNCSSMILHFSIMQGLDYIDHLDNACEIKMEERFPANYVELPNTNSSVLLINAQWSIV